MVRLLRSGRNERDTTTHQPMESQQRRSSASAGLGRKLFLALGIGALVYLLARRRDRDDSTRTRRVTDTLESDESGDDALEGAHRIEIGEPSSETGRTGGSDPAVDADSASMIERSDAEIDERVEPDLQEEPAEPGEMSVDEDVAAEVTDDEFDESNEREAADESGMKPDEAAETAGTSDVEQEAEIDGTTDTDEEDDATDTAEEDDPAETDG